MDISWCDPAGTKAFVALTVCSTGCVATDMSTCTRPVDFLRGRRLTVRTVGGAVLMDPQTGTAFPPTSAASVVVSHGEAGGGPALYPAPLATPPPTAPTAS